MSSSYVSAAEQAEADAEAEKQLNIEKQKAARRALKPGEWACQDAKCSHINAEFRNTCDKCGKPKLRAKSRIGREIGKDAAEKSKGLFAAEDWACTKCGNINWARRTTCNICNAPKLGDLEVRTGYGGGYMDREDVEYIDRDDDEEFDEFGRKKKKRRRVDGDEGDEDDQMGNAGVNDTEKDIETVNRLSNDDQSNEIAETTRDIVVNETANIDESEKVADVFVDKYNKIDDDDEEEDDDDDDDADLDKYDLTADPDVAAVTIDKLKNNKYVIDNTTDSIERANSRRSSSCSCSCSGGECSCEDSDDDNDDSRRSSKRRRNERIRSRSRSPPRRRHSPSSTHRH